MTLSKLLYLSVAVVLLAGAVAACSPLQTLNALTPSHSYRKAGDLAYGEHERQRLDIYAPRDAAKPAPVVVFFYGGSWNSGNRSEYEFVGEALASRGMVAVIADYRLYPEVRYPAFLEDCAAAVAWAIRESARYGGDPQRVYVMGHSAGAYNAAMVALDHRLLAIHKLTPSALHGWIGLAGPYDFLPIENPAVKPVFFHPNTPPDSQPVRHVTASASPALLIAPGKDDVVNPERNTGGMARTLRAAGIDVTEEYFDKTGHVTLLASLSRPLRLLAPTLDRIEQFVVSNDKGIAVKR
ncbi:alpha/beta hydrolase [Noviherbaspirillum saxi]|uniref:Alpha/beta hydrolase n=1 Tax=Noviherbaspirillum saxi TaxID=2320863 RepID=A0A3A3FZR7_9BURK|nr:alpha/beta hydrolase [Noviherbaspirillum saxi]RJF99691.1 alpha/beta hydrolase [Noviherbaspirillum saxi]